MGGGWRKRVGLQGFTRITGQYNGSSVRAARSSLPARDVQVHARLSRPGVVVPSFMSYLPPPRRGTQLGQKRSRQI